MRLRCKEKLLNHSRQKGTRASRVRASCGSPREAGCKGRPWMAALPVYCLHLALKAQEGSGTWVPERLLRQSAVFGKWCDVTRHFPRHVFHEMFHGLSEAFGKWA